MMGGRGAESPCFVNRGMWPMTARKESERVSTRLLGVCSVLRGLLAGATRDEVLTRHRVGTVLRDIKSATGTYGEHAVERAATELGVTVPTLYRHLAVAEAWSAEELRALIDHTDRFGQPLSWSHFVTLTRAPDPVARQALFEHCIEEAWSVRDLAFHLTEGPALENATEAVTPVREALAEGIRNATRAAVDVGIFAEALADRLMDDEPKHDAELFTRAIGAFEELRHRAEATLAQLHAANHASESRVRSAPSVRLEVHSSAEVSERAAQDEAAEEPPPRSTGARGHAPRR